MVILCFASGYEAPPTSKHHVMHVLAEQGNVVLWVNYHASRTPSASGADLRHIARKLGQVAGGMTNPRENLYVLTPLVVPLPGSRLVRRLNRALLVGQIRRALRKVGRMTARQRGQSHFRGFGKRLIGLGPRCAAKIGTVPAGPLEIWSFTPDVAYLLDRFGQPRVVYYCVDEHSQFTGYDAAQVLRDEEALCRRADLVVTTSGPLYESRKAWNPNTILVPHGVDYDHFARALADDLPEPADLSAIPRPRLGFFGLLRDWVDLDLLAEVARRRPDWHVVLLGGSTVDLAAYRPIANMHFLGPKPYADLPAYCRGFDVGLIPFKLNALTRAVNPIKLREYLAAGLPVVSTPLPEVERYAQWVKKGSGAFSAQHPPGRSGVKKGSGAFSAQHPPGRSGKRLLTPFSPPPWVSLAEGPDAFTAAVAAVLGEAGGTIGVGCQASGVSGSADRIARSAAMRGETWREKVKIIREEME
ncbi:MAG: glycosyltransferase [Thermoguttaceae bacterium]|jgi:glycosyltransferase involved in cell wall biosynthesis|nr:glycosyltransferase [Thermoguttaceae bacterium]